MKIITTFNALVINAKSTEYAKKDGTKGLLHSISFDQNGECGTVNCTEEVVKSALSNRLKDCVLEGEYNDQYRNFRILSLKPSAVEHK